MKPFFVVNPHSSCGANRGRFLSIEPQIRAAFPALGYAFTEAPLHAIELAEQAARDGADVVVASGGDGTLNEVACGLIASGRTEYTALAMMAGSTAGDFGRIAGFPTEPQNVVAYLLAAERRSIDSGMLEFVNRDGKECRRSFLNVASLGITGVMDRYMRSTSKTLGRKASFVVGSARGIWAYRNLQMRIVVDGRPFHEGPTCMVAIANGKYFFGGLRIAPEAKFDDGVFDVVVFEDVKKAEFVSLASLAYDGRHHGKPKVRFTRGAEVEVESIGDALVDVDGELVGRAPVRATIQAGGLTVLMPRG